MEPRRKEAVTRLLVVADEDRRATEMALGAVPAMCIMAAFHAQPAAEKYMKAWLIAAGDDEPRLTHNLSRLGDLLAQQCGTRLPEEPLVFLSEFAVAPRYGEPVVTAEEATRALEEAERLVAIAREAIDALLAESDTGSPMDPHLRRGDSL